LDDYRFRVLGTLLKIKSNGAQSGG
jgi:hypothetical protein